MIQTNSLQLSTNELAAALALCGYENIASEFIINIKDGKNGEETVNRFIEYTESTLKGKGYLDESRSSLLGSEIEDLLHLLMISTKKVRCIREEHVLFIHCIDEENVLIQEIKNQVHCFTKQKMSEGFENILRKHYRLTNTNSSFMRDRKTMLLSEDLYNELHNIDTQFLEHMISGNELDIDLRQFLVDFKNNNQQFNNLSFMEMDYIRDQMDLRQVNFMLPNKQSIWHLDYTKIFNKEVYIIPIEKDDYFRQLNQQIFNFFDVNNSHIR